MLTTDKIKQYFLTLQNSICQALLDVESSMNNAITFREDKWQRGENGGGITRVIERGAVFEKAGVNFSHVSGENLPTSATQQRPELMGRVFEAMGVSVVVHPDNPYIPASHLNVRFFSATQENSDPVWWFGGGFDLTPYYAFEEDCRHWHQVAHDVCQPFNQMMCADVYARYKKACDDYFYLKHRNEMRGIGGLFIDDLHEPDMQRCFDFIRSVGDGYLKAYLPIVNKRKHQAFGERQKRFQAYRRGRYVEFNLVLDRGTLFGLQTGGRTESILVSLPPVAHWCYDLCIDTQAEEAKLAQFLSPRDWL